MSKRKQRKPQHRKTIEKLEELGDSLTCGDCHLIFSLTDITQFIQHKVRKCDKENINPGLDSCLGNNSSDEENDDDNGDEDTKETVPVISSRCSISAPIAGRRGTPELRGGSSPRPALASITPVKMNEDGAEKLVAVPKRVDAESNTSSSEPIKFRCVSCSAVCNSAWSLLQHVQSCHHMRIYTETTSATLSLPCQAERYHNIERHGSENEQKLDSSKDDECSNGDYDDAFEDDDEAKDEDKVKDKDKVGSPADDTNTATNTIRTQDGSSPTNPFVSSFHLPSERTQHHSSPFKSTSYRPEQLRLEFGHQFHRQLGFGIPANFPAPPGLENPPHSAFPNPFDRTRPPFMSNFDFDLYSKRLRQLAEVKALPGMHLPVPKPVVQSISNHGNSSPSAFSPSKHSPSESGHMTPGTATARSPMTPGAVPCKLRACEFCGKSFKFQSNLIVHRRSHTGEKPFHCPLCSHACTQASKLKRHMKTHQKSSGGWSNMSNDSSSHPSESSSPDSEKAAIIAQRLKELGELESDNEIESGAEEEEEEENSDYEKKVQPSTSTGDIPNIESYHANSSKKKKVPTATLR